MLAKNEAADWTQEAGRISPADRDQKTFLKGFLKEWAVFKLRKRYNLLPHPKILNFKEGTKFVFFKPKIRFLNLLVSLAIST